MLLQKFKVKEWPKEEYGFFYTGDSYIVLNVYKEEDELKYDVHFWIGKYSTNVSAQHNKRVASRTIDVFV